jgi:ribosome-binding protein aMBF1 (putative translation factor)
MGNRVREPSLRAPSQHRVTRCPTCGHKLVVVSGAYLRWRRESAGVDQRTLAKRLQVSGPYLSDIERDRRDCPPSIEAEYRRLRG